MKLSDFVVPQIKYVFSVRDGQLSNEQIITSLPLPRVMFTYIVVIDEDDINHYLTQEVISNCTVTYSAGSYRENFLTFLKMIQKQTNVIFDELLFNEEQKTWKTHKAEWLQFEGKHVIIQKNKIYGPYLTFQEAYDAAIQMFPSYFVKGNKEDACMFKEILREEPMVFVNNFVTVQE